MNGPYCCYYAPFMALAQKKGKDTAFVFLDDALETTTDKKAAFQGVSVKVENGVAVVCAVRRYHSGHAGLL